MFDGLSSVMLVVVTLVSLLVHIYSLSYMVEDPHMPRFLSYLSLFTFMMLMLVTADNFLQLFLGWEGVGLSSYLLINFWFTRVEANRAAIKAIIVNRFGDFGLSIGIFGIFLVFNSLNFNTIFFLVDFYTSNCFYIYGFMFNSYEFISFFLFVGAVGKSAQIILHTWLPDAMEGPTPVSALIHAATMVTAGVFVLLRCSPILEFAPHVLVLITFLGSITAVISATIGAFQNDLKKVIAYSTCSQLGYMVFICGLSQYSIGLFHLVNHAFFKALLFLSAGSVIHALGDEQDMRKMGGLRYAMPITYVMFVIGSLSLGGFPFLSGFYSKDLILEFSLSQNYGIDGYFVFYLGVVAAFFTAFYSLRLIYVAFIAERRNKDNTYKYLHESS